MDWLGYFSGSPDALEKTPYLLLVGQDRTSELNDAAQVEGAVLLYEYCFAGQGTGVFATDDVDGVRTVVAPEGVRVRVAETAVRRLMGMGAVAVVASVSGEADGSTKSERGDPCKMAVRTRTVPYYLPLAGTLDATLAHLGCHTRRNLRYYRRRAVAELGVMFEPRVEMSLRHFLEVNRQSRNPADDAVARWRFSLFERGAEQSRALFAGLRTEGGQWLSLVGGRRHGDTAEIDWQMNAADLSHYSLCTVMRSFLLEHEIARETKRLVFLGGTPHTMRHSFASITTTDILAMRRWSARAWALNSFSRWIFPEKNFLRGVLADEEMRRVA